MRKKQKTKRDNGLASLFSEVFGALVAVAILFGGVAYKIEQHERAVRIMQTQLADEEEALEMRLAKIRKDEDNIVCTANIATHEVENQPLGVRDATIKVILAMADDPNFGVKGDVCALAKKRNLFSRIKYVHEVRSGHTEWATIFAQAADIYEGDRRLPKGWECVRAFRVSDEYLEKIGPIGRLALGIGPNQTGLKWFDETQTHVQTWKDISFFRHNNGCKHPHATMA